jgi:hypothetical protein
MRRIGIWALAALVAATAPSGAGAQSPQDRQRERAEDTIREGAEKMIRGLEQLLRSIPQYETPQVLENGDIIIRRKPPKEPAAKPKTSDGGERT